MTEKKKKKYLNVSSKLYKLSRDLRSTLKRDDEPGVSVKLALFLGAGASYQSGIPLSKEMVEHFINEICKDYKGVDEKDKMAWIKKQSWYKSDVADYPQFFEGCYGTKSRRRAYIESIVEKAQSSVGYIVLANLIKYGYVKTILTTNFDRLISIACANYTDITPVIYSRGNFAAEMKITSERPRILKLHGDFLYQSLVNTKQELETPDPNMEDQVTEIFKEYEGIIIVGYAGNDESVMNILEKALKGKTIYWCDLSEDCLSERARNLIKDKNGSFVKIEGFDEFMQVVRILVEMTNNNIVETFQNRQIEINKKLSEFEDVVLLDEETKEEIKSKDRTDFGEIFDTSRRVLQYLIKGNIAFSDSNYELVEKAYRRAIELNPHSASIYNRLGSLLEQNENYWPKAENIYREAIEIFPNNVEAYYNLATLLTKKEKRWDEAKDLFDEAIKKDPNSAMAVSCLGFLYYKQKNFNEAIKLFKKAIGLDYKLPFPYVNLSAVYKEMNVIKKSFEYNEKAKEILKPVDYYLWACLKSISREKDDALALLKKSIEQEPGRKLAAKYSPTFDWLRHDSDFNKLINN